MEFNYQARNSNGVLVTGTIDADSQEQAVSILHRKSLVVTNLEAKDQNVFGKDLMVFFNRPSNKDVVVFTRQLATLIDADIPLLEGLNILAEQTEKIGFKEIIESVKSSIEGGASLSSALNQQGHVFNNFYVNLVRVGEVSGKLQETLLYLADYLEHNATIVAKIRGALFYPLFLLGAMVIVIGIMMTSVIPQLLKIINESGVTELPLTTRLLISVTNFFNNYIFIWTFGLITLIIFIYYYIRTEEGRKFKDRLILSIPKGGSIIRNLYIARLSETLSVLVKAGVPILESLAITADVVNNTVYSEILKEAEANVRSGGNISSTFEKYSAFPSLVSSMIATGEKTGRVDYMLKNILKFYEAEAEESIKNISQLIEPVLILIIGVGIGGLVSAVLLPIYSLVGSF